MTIYVSNLVKRFVVSRPAAVLMYREHDAEQINIQLGYVAVMVHLHIKLHQLLLLYRVVYHRRIALSIRLFGVDGFVKTYGSMILSHKYKSVQ